MTSSTLTRRGFITGAAGVCFAFTLPGTARAGAGTPIGAWVHVAVDGITTVMCPASEMGQGSMTALPLIFAEEMDLDWEQVRIELSPADDGHFHNPAPWAHGIMLTLGSSAVSGYFDAIRRHGAQARRVLLDAAAAHWSVPWHELTTEPSVIRHAPSGRAMHYGRAAMRVTNPIRLPEITPEMLKPRSAFRLIGTNPARRDIPAKVRGEPVYSIDVALPGMLHAAVVRAPVLGASPLRVDDAAARDRAGVVDVVALPDAVAVVARHYHAALSALRALEVVWSEVPGARGLTAEACQRRYRHAAVDLARDGVRWQDSGDIEAAFAGATRVHSAEYLTDYQYHAQLEPLNAVADVRADGRSVEVWAGTQAPTHCTRAVAAVLGIESTHVRLHRSMLGGGFGRRGAQDHDFVTDAVRLSQATGRPVKAIWSRETDVQAGRLRPATAQYLRAAEDADGRLIGWQHRTASDEPHRQADPYRYRKNDEWPVIAGLGIDCPYAIEHRRCEVLVQETPVRISPMRGVGASLNRFAAESFLDEIAASKGVDPLALRLRLLAHRPAARRVLEAVAAMAAWPERRPEDGLGLAYGEEETLFAVIASVQVGGDGEIRVPRIWVALDVGLAVHPHNIRAQVEGAVIFALGNALTERITLTDGAIDQRNFDDYVIPGMRDAPEVAVRIIADGDRAPSGVGDTAPIVVPAAIANGLAARTGRRLRHLPMTPERVRAALARAAAEPPAAT